MKTEIIPITEKAKWNRIISSCKNHDFYHCHSYNTLDHSGHAFLFTVTDESGDIIAFPLISRPIAGTGYFDCTSVYGYPGPISNKALSLLSSGLIRHFRTALSDYLKEAKIVAAFSRLHPFLEQSPLLYSMGEVVPFSKTVAIDLMLLPTEQRQRFNSTNKRHLNRLRREGYTIRKAETAAQIDEFTAVYEETMRRVNANGYYFFDREYFHRLLYADDFLSFLLLAYKGEELAAGAIFAVTNTIMQYHLSGTKDTHLHAAPMKLVIDEARLTGERMGLQYLHLGGGVGGKEDSLFRFKSSFSDLTFTHKVWRMVVNEPVYRELVAARSKEKELQEDYFPLYRS